MFASFLDVNINMKLETVPLNIHTLSTFTYLTRACPLLKMTKPRTYGYSQVTDPVNFILFKNEQFPNCQS